MGRSSGWEGVEEGGWCFRNNMQKTLVRWNSLDIVGMSTQVCR
jgi:hypothetical protein